MKNTFLNNWIKLILIKFRQQIFYMKVAEQLSSKLPNKLQKNVNNFCLRRKEIIYRYLMHG